MNHADSCNSQEAPSLNSSKAFFFVVTCASCHGEAGAGNGPAAGALADQSHRGLNYSHYVRAASGVVAIAGFPPLDRGTEILPASAGTQSCRARQGARTGKELIVKW